MDNSKTALIIGAGIAGLAAGTLLSGRGYKVIVLEQKNILGGRTASFIDPLTREWLDNGPHVIMSCYEYTRRWLASIAAGDSICFESTLAVDFREPGGGYHTLSFTGLLPPFSLLAAMVCFPPLSIQEKIRFLKTARRLIRTVPAENPSVTEWLKKHGHNGAISRYVWNPLCVAIMNEDPNKASAQIFFKAVNAIFFDSTRRPARYVSTRSFFEWFIQPAVKRIQQNDGIILTGTAVREIVASGKTITEVVSKKGERFKADIYINAVPPWQWEKIIAPFNPYPAISGNPIISAYVWFRDKQTADRYLGRNPVAALDTTIQWLFRKNETMAGITVSNAHGILAKDQLEIREIIMNDFSQLFASFRRSDLLRILVLKEPHAAFPVNAGPLPKRPGIRTDFENLFLIGDATDTGLPSTIESAVKSAYLLLGCLPV